MSSATNNDCIAKLLGRHTNGFTLYILVKENNGQKERLTAAASVAFNELSKIPGLNVQCNITIKSSGLRDDVTLRREELLCLSNKP